MQLESLRILVIEDNPALRTSMAALIESHGHRIDFAADIRHGERVLLAGFTHGGIKLRTNFQPCHPV